MEGNSRLLQGFIILLSVFYASQSAKLMYDISIVPEHCMTAKAIEANYTPKGTEYEIGNLTVYEAQNRTAKRVLIAVYDIFGLSTNMKQVVDQVSELYDFRVVMPDFFRGIYWDETNFPPEE